MGCIVTNAENGQLQEIDSAEPAGRVCAKNKLTFIRLFGARCSMMPGSFYVCVLTLNRMTFGLISLALIRFSLVTHPILISL